MTIDAHHHLWRYRTDSHGWIDPNSILARDYLPDDYRDAARRMDAAAAIVVQAEQTSEETAWLCGMAHSDPSIAGVVGWLDLRSPTIGAEIGRWMPAGLIGLRHIVQAEPDPEFLLQPDFIRGVGIALDAGLAYDILVIGRQVPVVPEFVDRLPPGRLVLDHGAKPAIATGGWQPWADAIAEIATRPNVWCKLSGLVTEADHATWSPEQIEPYMLHLLRHFGPERLIFGSDWPVCLLAASVGQVHALIADFVDRHCPAHRDAVFGANARRAYGLD